MTKTSDNSTAVYQLELISVLKASQAISAEIELPKLIEKLLQVMMEHAGANRAVLLLDENNELSPFAEANADVHAEITVRFQKVRDDYSTLPWSVINYVQRLGTHLLIDDVRIEERFNEDPYLSKLKTGSILALPLTRHQRITGVIYLENTHLSGVFSPERLTVIELLNSQVAISVENSTYFKASEDAVRIRDEFMSVASHELRTPLTSLRLQTQMLTRASEESLTLEKIKKFLSLADRSTERLAQLLEDILDVSSIATGNLELHVTHFDLSELTGDLIRKLTPLLNRHSCSIRVELEDELRGSWDKTRLEQVMTNLIMNAVKYGGPGIIDLRLRKVRNNAEISVKDYGPGIPDDVQTRIFERYERATSSNEVSGLGLGLYISKQIIQLHRGKLSVQSKPGEGSNFLIALPLG